MNPPVFRCGAFTRKNKGFRTSRSRSAATSAHLFSLFLAFLHCGHEVPEAGLLLSSGAGEETGGVNCDTFVWWKSLEIVSYWQPFPS